MIKRFLNCLDIIRLLQHMREQLVESTLFPPAFSFEVLATDASLPSIIIAIILAAELALQDFSWQDLDISFNDLSYVKCATARIFTTFAVTDRLLDCRPRAS